VKSNFLFNTLTCSDSGFTDVIETGF